MRKSNDKFSVKNLKELVQKKRSQGSKLSAKPKNEECESLLGESLRKKDEAGITVSKHAAKRLDESNITMDNKEYNRLQEAVLKLKNKGGKDSLVITKKAAYIIDVNHGKIVTAIDKERLSENIFTKIDSTVIVDS